MPSKNTKTETIQGLIHRVNRLERMRQDFVANVSHELRTPLTVIHGYLEILLNEDLANLPEPKKILTQIYQQSLRMERLVEDLLLLSRLDSALLENEKLQKIPVPHLLHGLAKDAQMLSGDRQHAIKLNIDENLEIYGVESELRSIFSNLIFNAVHYTPAQGSIEIKWYRVKNLAYFSVVDSGIGIAAEHIPRLTERFYRVAEDRSRQTGGTGLGLAIVKHALMRHKGQLNITSEVGKGSEFCCTFPLAL